MLGKILLPVKSMAIGDRDVLEPMSVRENRDRRRSRTYRAMSGHTKSWRAGAELIDRGLEAFRLGLGRGQTAPESRRQFVETDGPSAVLLRDWEVSTFSIEGLLCAL